MVKRDFGAGIVVVAVDVVVNVVVVEVVVDVDAGIVEVVVDVVVVEVVVDVGTEPVGWKESGRLPQVREELILQPDRVGYLVRPRS